MRGHGAALLRQPGHVDQTRALAFEMCGHANERAHGHNAGSTDTGQKDATRLVERQDRRWIGQVFRRAADGIGFA